MELSALITPEPGTVRVRARVEPDPRSRALTIEWWTPDSVGGSHLITLEGDRAAITHDYEIKSMDAGSYVVTARLVRNDGSQIKREAQMLVVGDTTTFTTGSF
jgi:hypothetical protein